MAPSRRIACFATALLAALACRARRTAVIGDEYPRNARARSIVDVVRDAFDSTGSRVSLRIDRWSIGENDDLDAATAQAERFAAVPELIGVVGPAGSRIALLSSAVYNARGITQLVPNATSHRLASAGRWTFMLSPDDGVEGAALAEYALDSLQRRRLSMFYLGDEYGTGLRDGVEAALRARGLTLVDQVLIPANDCSTTWGSELMRVVVRASVRRAVPEVVLLAMTAPMAACVAPAIEAAAQGVWYLSADGVEPHHPSLRPLSPGVRQRFRTVVFAPAQETARGRDFRARARRVLGREPSGTEALIYDSYLLLADAVRAAGPDREGVRRWLWELGRSRPAWRGVTGEVSFAAPRRELLRLVPLEEPAR